MNSTLGFLKTSTVFMPSCQQVLIQGLSAQNICTSEQPFTGYVYFINWSSTGAEFWLLPHQEMGGFRIASWSIVLGKNCFWWTREPAIMEYITRSSKHHSSPECSKP